ncbi:MAG: hypothetical protein ABI151_01530 [Chitinophagaceae bacterium]
MFPFTSKELYIVNGGQKHIIGRDGFWDVYRATQAEEEEWAKEVIEISLSTIRTSENSMALQSAIENLTFQNYPDLITVLVNSIPGASPAKQLAFAMALWQMQCNEKDFEIIFDILLRYQASCIKIFFQQPANFKKHAGARFFLVKCLEQSDEELFENAKTILSIWASSGLPELRENGALDRLQFHNRNLPASTAAINRLKEIVTTNN